MIDLSHTLTANIPRFPGDPEVRIEPLPGFAPWQVSAITMGTHSGTHLDAPRHRIPEGAGIGAFGPERLIGSGVVVEAPEFPENVAIPASVLDPVRDRLGPGMFAIVRTGWDRFWGDDRYFRHPFLSPGLAQALVDADAGIVAIDALSVDSTVDGGDVAHRILLGNGTLIAENLCRLDRLSELQSPRFAFLPLPLGDADGAPARVVAWDAATLPE
jgi:kynurenine formamidase